jgi:hypothetical protein
MRMQGAVVPSATVSDFPLPPELRDWPAFTAAAQIEIEPGDRASNLDLRCFVDLPLVWVESFSPRRLAGICAAISAAGAKRVIGVQLQRAPHGPQVAAMTDTEGAALWPN